MVVCVQEFFGGIMGNYIRKGAFVALALFIIMSAGCAKKIVGDQTPVNPYGEDETFTIEERSAASVISNGTIYFAYDSFELRPDSKESLTQKAQIMKQFPQLRVVIEGNCDERGTEEYNLALGERRARAAFEFLVNLGVPASQIDMVSFGKLHPAVPGGGEGSWAKNRRDEFKVTKTRY